MKKVLLISLRSMMTPESIFQHVCFWLSD